MANVRCASEDSTRAAWRTDLTSVKSAQWITSLQPQEPLIWTTVP